MGENNLTYIVEDNKRVLDSKSKQKIQEEYLAAGGLFPFILSTSSVSKLGEKLKNSMVLTEPQLIVKAYDIHKEVFAVILFMLSKLERKYLYYKVVTCADIVQVYLSGEYHDLGEAYANYKVLFITISNADMPHVYYPICLRNISELRKQRGLYTYIFYKGNRSDLNHNRWCIDESVSGKYRDAADSFTPLPNFINCINLNDEQK